MADSIRKVLASVITILFSVSLFDALFKISKIITPGISKVYNFLGTQIEPNMVTLIVFDWRGYDTLGESLILVTTVLVVLLVFGRGRLKGDDQNE